MRFTQIKETCLYISDLDRTEEFYCNKLDFELISKVQDRHTFFRVGSSVLLCFLPEITRVEKILPPHYAEGPQHIAFEVTKEDYSSIKSQIVKADIKICHVKEWKNGDLESFYFYDPDGHVLEVVPEGLWD